jgi:hypothetical protein
MKVKELQEKLGKLDPNLEVVCYSEDEILQHLDRGFRLLDILAVSTTDGERARLDDGTPYLKLGKGPDSSTIALLEVTVDF